MCTGDQKAQSLVSSRQRTSPQDDENVKAWLNLLGPPVSHQPNWTEDHQITQGTVPPALHSRGMIYQFGNAKKTHCRNTCLFSGLTPLPFRWLCPAQENGERRGAKRPWEKREERDWISHVQHKCPTTSISTDEVWKMDLIPPLQLLPLRWMLWLLTT